MASRNAGPRTPRRSPRINARSETPDARTSAFASTPSRRALSPELIEQLTPPVASYRARRPLNALHALANGSTSASIKQEDASTSYYVREASQSTSATGAAPYQPAILRGAQRGSSDPREANNSLSASLSIFSSGSSDHADNYQQEERELARIQENSTRQAAPSKPVAKRRTSGPRKGRTSLEDRLYRPGRDDEDNDDDDDVEHDDDDDDDDKRSKRRRKGRNSGDLSAVEKGRIDNVTWMNATRKKGRKSGRRSLSSVQPGENDDLNGPSIMEHGEDDAGAASGKETRFDGASEPESDLTDLDTPVVHQVKQARQTAQSDTQPESSAKSTMSEFIFAVLSYLFKHAKLAFMHVGRWISTSAWRNILAFLCALIAARAAMYMVFGPSSTSENFSLPDRLPSWSSPYQYPTDDDVPYRSSQLDQENKRLHAELRRLAARFDTLSNSIESHISSQILSASAKIQADADSRKEADLSRLTASTKRQISRLANEELKSIQESVSNSVEVMLRDLDRKIDGQLKKRADDTEGRYFSQLEQEIGKISRFATEEVNARLAQSFDHTFLTELIEDRLERYSRDRTGKVDYAAVTSGAWVVESGTVHRGYRYNSVWNIKAYLAQGRKVPIGDPVKAITPGASLGQDNCWMTGWNSMLQVNLAEPKVVDEVVLEHPLPGMTRTAPRRVIVWGLVDESDRQYYTQYRKTKAKTTQDYLQTLLPEPFYKTVPQEYKNEAPLVLAFFEFKSSGSTLQTFNTTEEAQFYPHGVQAVRWQFIDGWAKNPPICVHRVRVHGSDWPVFADKQNEKIPSVSA